MNDAGSSNAVVPVDPSLCRAFQNLQLIDEYRLTGHALLLDRLIANVESPVELNQQSSDAYSSQEDCYEDEESEDESETMVSRNLDQQAFNVYLRRQPLEKITEEENLKEENMQEND